LQEFAEVYRSLQEFAGVYRSLQEFRGSQYKQKALITSYTIYIRSFFISSTFRERKELQIISVAFSSVVPSGRERSYRSYP
jgi:hypothetical protein